MMRWGHAWSSDSTEYLFATNTALASIEDGAEQCGDGRDNDFDGLTDCFEKECDSSSEFPRRDHARPRPPCRAAAPVSVTQSFSVCEASDLACFDP